MILVTAISKTLDIQNDDTSGDISVDFIVICPKLTVRPVDIS